MEISRQHRERHRSRRTEYTTKVSEDMDTEAQQLTVHVISAISKAGREYECLEIRLGDVSVGRLFPTPLEMAAIRAATQE